MSNEYLENVSCETCAATSSGRAFPLQPRLARRISMRFYRALADPCPQPEKARYTGILPRRVGDRGRTSPALAAPPGLRPRHVLKPRSDGRCALRLPVCSSAKSSLLRLSSGLRARAAAAGAPAEHRWWGSGVTDGRGQTRRRSCPWADVAHGTPRHARHALRFIGQALSLLPVHSTVVLQHEKLSRCDHKFAQEVRRAPFCEQLKAAWRAPHSGLTASDGYSDNI